MSVLSGLKPEQVFRYFEEIAGIPHGSGNVDKISNYLVDFAKERNLTWYQDELKNVIIIKEATAGYEKEPAVILQGHMDMVAVKKPDCDIDMKTEGLRLAVDEDMLYAEGTSLGGDDGIAVAYSLALLDSDTIAHPKLEVIITVDEEVGMDGARAIDLSMLTGKRMINLDSEEEGYFLTSCAGGARVKNSLTLETQEYEGAVFELKLGGLLGGHSGEGIKYERGNSNCLFGRVLRVIAQALPVGIVEAQGGLADNAIPRETRAVVTVNPQDKALLQELVSRVGQEIADELSTKDPGFSVQLSARGVEKQTATTSEATVRAADFLCALPNGVMTNSADMPGLVETSLNLGILEYRAGCLVADFSVRSSVESAKKALIDKVCSVARLAGAETEISGDYPGWKFRKDSPLRDKMIRVYREMYGKEPQLLAIHAGLECGLLSDKIAGLDCVSIGPDMHAIHTTEETLSISSTARVWEYLVKLLETKE